MFKRKFNGQHYNAVLCFMKIESLTNLKCYHIEKSEMNLDVRYESIRK